MDGIGQLSGERRGEELASPSSTHIKVDASQHCGAAEKASASMMMSGDGSRHVVAAGYKHATKFTNQPL